MGGQVDTVGGVGAGKGQEEDGDSVEAAEESVLRGGGGEWVEKERMAMYTSLCIGRTRLTSGLIQMRC